MLKMLAKDARVGLAASAVASAAAAAAKKKAPKQPTVAKKRARAVVPSDDSEDEEDDFDASIAASKRRKPARAAATKAPVKPDSDSDESGEDLFDSDEEEEANILASSSKKKAVPKAKAVAKPAATKAKSRLEEYEDEDSEGAYSDDSDRAARGRSSGYSKPAPDSDGEDDRYHRERDADSDEGEDTSDPASLEDYQRIQVRRVFLEKWLHEPYLEQAVVHQYARIYVGQNAENIPVYRMCEVVGIGKRAPYKLSDSGAMTDKALIVAIGSSQVTKKLEAVSNSRITELELKRYLDDLHTYNEKHGKSTRILTKNDTTRRRAEAMKVLQNHKYTDDEIKKLIQQRSGHNTFLTTDYTTAREKLLEKIEKAQNSMDGDSAATVLKMQREVEKMDRNYNAHREKLEAETSKQVSLNLRNKGVNKANDIVASVRRAEKELTKDSDKEVSKSAIDPFRRRETLPSIIWNTSSNEINSRPKAEIEKEKAAAKNAEAAAIAAAAAAAFEAGAKSAATSTEYNLFVDTDIDLVGLVLSSLVFQSFKSIFCLCREIGC